MLGEGGVGFLWSSLNTVHAFMAMEGSLSSHDKETTFLPPVLLLMNDRYPLYQNASLSDGCCCESLRRGTLEKLQRKGLKHVIQ